MQGCFGLVQDTRDAQDVALAAIKQRLDTTLLLQSEGEFSLSFGPKYDQWSTESSPEQVGSDSHPALPSDICPCYYA